MPYAVMQKGLEAPRVEQLKAAFKGVPGLTPMDAPILCKDAFGILVKGFELEPANMLQVALAGQGVDTEVVDEKSLPGLPPMRHVNRVDCTPEALLIYDPLGRSFPLEWQNVLMIAAGSVSVIEFKRTSTPATLTDQNPALAAIDNLFGADHPLRPRAQTTYQGSDYHTEEQYRNRWWLEVVIAGAKLRYNMEGQHAGQPLFQYLGERRTDDLTANFKMTVQDMCRMAPNATINRGAYYLREDNAVAFAYPSKNAFYEEMIWLLWQLQQAGRI